MKKRHFWYNHFVEKLFLKCHVNILFFKLLFAFCTNVEDAPHLKIAAFNRTILIEF